MRLAIVQQHPDKHHTLAYEYDDRWYSYSNNKYLKWVPKDWVFVVSFDWHEESITSYVRGTHFVVQSEEGNIVLATREGDDWFSLHTGRRLLVNVIRWARVTWKST